MSGARPARIIVARSLWKTYQFNLSRARALIQSQRYLETLSRDGDGAIKAYTDRIVTGVMGLAGIDYDKMMGVMESVMAPIVSKELEAQISRVDPKAVAAKFEKRAGRESEAEAMLRPLIEPFVNLGLLQQRTLIQSGVVMAVAAYEALLRDLIAVEARRRPTVIRLFPEVEKKTDHKLIRRYSQNARRAQADLLSRSLSAHKSSQVRSYIKRMFGVTNIFGTDQLKDRIDRVTKVRNLIVHRGGVIDKGFQSSTRWRQSQGVPIDISNPMALDWIDAFHEFGLRLLEYSPQPWAKMVPRRFIPTGLSMASEEE